MPTLWIPGLHGGEIQFYWEGSGEGWPLTSRKILMALEQVTPVVPQGTFSVTMRKVPLVVLLPQWSWNRTIGQVMA